LSNKLYTNSKYFILFNDGYWLYRKATGIIHENFMGKKPAGTKSVPLFSNLGCKLGVSKF